MKDKMTRNTEVEIVRKGVHILKVGTRGMFVGMSKGYYKVVGTIDPNIQNTLPSGRTMAVNLLTREDFKEAK